MARARNVEELIAGMAFDSRRRGKTVAEFARREAMLDAASEIEALLDNEGESGDFASIMRTWVKATREEAAIAAAEYEKE